MFHSRRKLKNPTPPHMEWISGNFREWAPMLLPSLLSRQKSWEDLLMHWEQVKSQESSRKEPNYQPMQIPAVKPALQAWT